MTKLTLPPALPCSIKDKRKEINGGVGWDRLRKGKEQDVHLSSFCLWLYLYTLDTRRTGRPNFTFNTLKKKHIKNQINKHQLCIVPMVEVWWINSPRYAQWFREDTEMHRLHKHLLRWFRKVFFSLSGEHLLSVLLVLLFLSILPLLFRPEQRNTHLELIIKRVSEVTSVKFEPYFARENRL